MIMPPTLNPNIAIETDMKEKWYHKVTEKMRVSTISNIRVEKATKKTPIKVFKEISRFFFFNNRINLPKNRYHECPNVFKITYCDIVEYRFSRISHSFFMQVVTPYVSVYSLC
jgi:hypothetical protein